MKTLTLMRHADSSWDDAALSDFERSLNERGLQDAPLIAKVLKQRAVMPDLFLASPANRTKTTANIIAKGIGFGLEDICYHDSIYESSDFNLLMLIKGLDAEVQHCFLLGHNPALTSVINKLVRSFTLPALPSSGVVSMRFSSSWAEIEPYSGEMLFYEHPKKDPKEQSWH